MICNSNRKCSKSAARQMVLALGKGVWALSRPSTRILRAIRAARAGLIKVMPQIVEWLKTTTPQWVKELMMKAKAMVAAWKAAQMELPFMTETAVKPLPMTLPEVKRQAADNDRKAKHAGLIPCFVRLVTPHWMYECQRNQYFGGYRQMYGFIESENRCQKKAGLQRESMSRCASLHGPRPINTGTRKTI